MSTMRALIVAVVAAIATTMLAGCGEEQQVTIYKQGRYQGKPDTRPWENPPFNGNQAEWERAIKTRNLTQNEYRRTN